MGLRGWLLGWMVCAGLTGQSSPGHFAYYLLALSWSPEYCAGPGTAGSESLQCGPGRRYGFVVHGFWPQYEPHGWPEDCGTRERLTRPVIQSVLDIMPSEQLVRHEWRRHGTCSGLDPKGYFAKVRKAFDSVRMPPELQRPNAEVYMKPGDLRDKLMRANPKLPARSVAVLCSGRYLKEVRICFDKDLQPRACPPTIRDRCSAEEMIVRPVR